MVRECWLFGIEFWIALNHRESEVGVLKWLIDVFYLFTEAFTFMDINTIKTFNSFTVHFPYHVDLLYIPVCYLETMIPHIQYLLCLW